MTPEQYWERLVAGTVGFPTLNRLLDERQEGHSVIGGVTWTITLLPENGDHPALCKAFAEFGSETLVVMEQNPRKDSKYARKQQRFDAEYAADPTKPHHHLYWVWVERGETDWLGYIWPHQDGPEFVATGEYARNRNREVYV